MPTLLLNSYIVAQDFINNVKLNSCGIKGYEQDKSK